MELNRNHFFIAGTLLLLIGVQLRYVDSYVLNEGSTRFLAARFGNPSENTSLQRPILSSVAVPRKVIHPPEWLGWLMISVGTVLVLQSFVMRRPGG